MKLELRECRVEDNLVEVNIKGYSVTSRALGLTTRVKVGPFPPSGEGFGLKKHANGKFEVVKEDDGTNRCLFIAKVKWGYLGFETTAKVLRILESTLTAVGVVAVLEKGDTVVFHVEYSRKNWWVEVGTWNGKAMEWHSEKYTDEWVKAHPCPYNSGKKKPDDFPVGKL
jgi:hypothetical protein